MDLFNLPANYNAFPGASDVSRLSRFRSIDARNPTAWKRNPTWSQKSGACKINHKLLKSANRRLRSDNSSKANLSQIICRRTSNRQEETNDCIPNAVTIVHPWCDQHICFCRQRSTK